MKTVNLLLLVLSINAFSQNHKDKPTVDPKGNWYFGFELGTNTILSNDFERPTAFQIGISSEYYFSKHWSLLAKLKQYETQVAYTSTPDFLSNGIKPYNTLSFSGKIISIPLNIKFETGLIRNFRGYISWGLAYNIETKSDYYIPTISNPDISMFPTKYFSLNGELGFEYFFNKKIAAFITSGINYGGYKGRTDSFPVGGTDLVSINTLLNFGVKYNFKNK